MNEKCTQEDLERDEALAAYYDACEMMADADPVCQPLDKEDFR